MREKNKVREKKGITLIALVVTIIVLLILAGITIVALSGENGILKHLISAKEKTEIAQQEEGDILKEYTALLDADGLYAKDISKMGSEEVKNIYGKYITNYNPQGNNGIGGESPVSKYKWQIFYADEENIYLIASDYINNPPNSANQSITKTEKEFEFIMNKVLEDYEGSNSITNEKLKKLNGNYYEFLENNHKSIGYSNIKAVAYMLDTSKWNPLFCDSTYASYAIGTPTLELLMKSYNHKYNGNYVAGSLQLNNEHSANTIGEKGYYISEDRGTTWGVGTQENEFLSLDSTYNVDNNKSWRMALASPCGDGGKLIYRLMGGGKLSCYNCDSEDSMYSFRPIVCLKSNVKIKPDGDNYRITTKSANEIKYEFEKGTIKGTGSVINDDNSSGKKYMHLESTEDEIKLTIDIKREGMYNITICYKAPYGKKVQHLYVNDEYQTSISLARENWTEIDCGDVKFKKGKNELAIKAYWGWADFDYVIISETTQPEVRASQTTLCDKNATIQTKNLMSYLSSVYGNHIISGQQEIYLNGHAGNYEYEFDYIKNVTGKLPAIRGFDYIFCNPLNGYPNHATKDGTTDRIIDWVKNNNGIATTSWHLIVPKDFENYTIGQYVASANATYRAKENEKISTTFDTSKVVVKGTKEYEYYQLCLKNLAIELKILQDNNVPIIFRPLHEAEGAGGEDGAWFWWGKDGSEVYKQLWKLTYETLTQKYGLHNLIWAWNSYNYETSANWYPGDEYVDIISYDRYISYISNDKTKYEHNDSPLSSTFYGIMKKNNGKKMIAMSENDCFSTVKKLKEQRAGWLYFCTWYDGYSEEGGGEDPNYVTNPIFNTKKDMIEMYQSDYCITRDELPSQLYSAELQNW